MANNIGNDNIFRVDRRTELIINQKIEAHQVLTISRGQKGNIVLQTGPKNHSSLAAQPWHNLPAKSQYQAELSTQGHSHTHCPRLAR